MRTGNVVHLSQKVTIDACQIYGPDTVFLQQAAHLTGGSYIFLERRDALLQYLIVSPRYWLYLTRRSIDLLDVLPPTPSRSQGPVCAHSREDRLQGRLFLS